MGTMNQYLKPGVTSDSLVACCRFTLEEADALVASMKEIVSAEIVQVFKPTITIGGGSSGSSGSSNQQQTTSTQTTTHTTEKSSDDSSSSGCFWSLLLLRLSLSLS